MRCKTFSCIFFLFVFILTRLRIFKINGCYNLHRIPSSFVTIFSKSGLVTLEVFRWGKQISAIKFSQQEITLWKFSSIKKKKKTSMHLTNIFHWNKNFSRVGMWTLNIMKILLFRLRSSALVYLSEVLADFSGVVFFSSSWMTLICILLNATIFLSCILVI